MLNQIQTVSQITTQIKQLLEREHRFVAVSGEISNLKVPFSGHHYFTLKDSSAQLRAVLFKGQSRYLSEALRDGQQVICRGRLSVYEPRGEYQLIVDTVEQYGLGMLQLQFAALKKQLAEEGLFAEERKRPLPPFPRSIVVISSPTGAAIRDFLKICALRSSSVTLQIFPVPVQGELAAPTIARAIATVNDKVPCDIIVLCRGGGSIEDLWAFNEEIVARAIACSRIPVVTGIGHETDTTIADLSADFRCPTPTGAAEKIIPDNVRLRQQVQRSADRLHRMVQLQIGAFAAGLNQQWRHLRRYRLRVENLSFRLDPVVERFHRSVYQTYQQRRQRLDRLQLRLEHQAPLARISYRAQHLVHLQRELHQHMGALLSRYQERLAQAAALLQGVSPLSTLSRGYAIVRATDHRSGELFVVKESDQVAEGDTVDVRLHSGSLSCEVLKRHLNVRDDDPNGQSIRPDGID